ncbi:SHOCT domain-containing protein [Candidatus Pelagibacter sp.]|nr:SHOCT domain-containing protein [Candidatus Pelagibacter sp.]
MEKLIFFGLVVPIFLFVLYLGGTAIMTGFSAKEANRKIKDEEEDNISPDQINDDQSLSDQLEKLNKLKESGVLTQEEFEKAKNKLLNN